MPEPEGRRFTTGAALNWLRLVAMRATFPFIFGDAARSLQFLSSTAWWMLFNDCVEVGGGRNGNRDFIPHPLAGGGEVEVLSADREAIHKGNAAASGMAFVG